MSSQDPLLYHTVNVLIDTPTHRPDEDTPGPTMKAGSQALFVEIDEAGKCTVEYDDKIGKEWFAIVDRKDLEAALIGLPEHEAAAERRLRMLQTADGAAERGGAQPATPETEDPAQEADLPAGQQIVSASQS
jgi:hypothetical protein